MAPFRQESFSKFTFKWCFLLQICVVETCNFIHISPILSRNTFIRSNNACRPVVWEQSVGLNMAYFFIFILNIDLKNAQLFLFPISVLRETVNGEWSTDMQSFNTSCCSFFFLLEDPSAFETSLTFHCILSALSKSCQQPDLPLLVKSWMCLWTKQSERKNTARLLPFPFPPSVSLSLCINLYLPILWCRSSSLLASPECWLFWSSEKWLHFVTQWLACLLASAAVN